MPATASPPSSTTPTAAVSQFSKLLERANASAWDSVGPTTGSHLFLTSLRSDTSTGPTYIIATFSSTPPHSHSDAGTPDISALSEVDEKWLESKLPAFTGRAPRETPTFGPRDSGIDLEMGSLTEKNNWEKAIATILKAAYDSQQNADGIERGQRVPVFAHSGEAYGGVTMLGEWDVGHTGQAGVEEDGQMEVRLKFDTELDMRLD